MSLTLSISPQNHVFNDYPYGHTTRLDSPSTDTVRYHGRREISSRHPSSSTGKASGTVSDEEYGDAATSSCGPAAFDHGELHAPDSNNQIPFCYPSSEFRASRVPELQSNTSKAAITRRPRSESRPTGMQNSYANVAAASNEARPMAREHAPSPFIPEEACSHESSAFHRWLSTLRRRRSQLNTSAFSPCRPLLSPSTECVALQNDSVHSCRNSGNRRNSVSNSSSAFVTGIKSATITLGDSMSTSKLFPDVQTFVAWPKKSIANISNRKSNESETLSTIDSFSDQIAHQRAVRRREILEELLDSEKNYVNDLKMLVNVYFTLLTSACALSSSTRDSIRENVTEILEVHEKLLENLRKVIPSVEFPFAHKDPSESPMLPRGHVRWHSADNAQRRARNSRIARKLRHSLDIVRPAKSSSLGVISHPETAGAVAKLFSGFASQLLAYEEYCAKYEMMVKDLGATYKTVPTGQAFDKGIEILSKTLDAINDREPNSRKGMSFADLLIKPVQRVCKYPLIFENLYKSTPVSDGPEAHVALERVLFRLREAAKQINLAKDDPKRRKLLETTWLLQDRLRFPKEVSLSVIHRVLGSLQLCGVLHVAYQSTSEFQGQYMLCALFKTCLVVAQSIRGSCFYHVVASIPLANITLEESDSGRGLQCHTAPFSWKIVFESDHRLFELLFSACSQVEEEQWRKSILAYGGHDDVNSMAETFCSILELDLRPIGNLFGQSHSLASRLSIQRAATLGPNKQMHQVIIKNTQSPEQVSLPPTETSISLGRSHSMLSSSQIPLLAPRRSERMALELALADVWTKDTLPFPGMRPAESSFRTSANHVIRKLSMASITSTLSKRTSSFVTFNKPEPRVPTPIDFGLKISKMRDPKRRPQHPTKFNFEDAPTQPVDFHNTPEAFLPPDFELKDLRRSKPNRYKPTIRAVQQERVNSLQTSSPSPDTAMPVTNPAVKVTAGPKQDMNMPAKYAVRIGSSPLNDENVPKVPLPKGSKLVKENSEKTPKPLQPITKHFRRLFN